jgi:hypothetical protein
LQVAQEVALQSVDLLTQEQAAAVLVATEQTQDLASVHPLPSKSVQAVARDQMESILFFLLSPQQAAVQVVGNLLEMVRLAVLAAVAHIQAQVRPITAAQLLHQVKVTQVAITVQAQHRLQQVAVAQAQLAAHQLAILLVQVAQDLLLQ